MLITRTFVKADVVRKFSRLFIWSPLFSTTSSLSIPTQTMAEVKLLWQMSNESSGHVRIQLQEDDDSVETGMTNIQKQSAEIPNDDTNNRLSSDTDSIITIPESVLQYERQMRKAQHAKKAGNILHPNQLQVLHVDDDIVLVNKPPGVLTVPGINSNSCLLDLVHAAYGSLCPDKNTMIVHRLDMDTSGLVVFGRTPSVTKELHSIFSDRRVRKEYEALIVGHLPEPIQSGHIGLSLQRDHQHPPFMRVSTPQSEIAAQQAVVDLQTHGWKKLVAKKPKPCQTEFTVIKRDISNHLPLTRLRLIPVTGRTHQLRVHCAALGFPIIGDPTYSLYGEAAMMGGLANVPSILQTKDESVSIPHPSIDLQQKWLTEHPPNQQPMCLHASLLEFEHPTSGEPMTWEAPPSF